MKNEDDPHEPKSRVIVGVAAICLWIVAWSVLVVSAAPTIEGWPTLVQMLFYLIAGLGWIVPLKPALRWMETGRWN
ncbi:DUF2842 domain-containing protein [Sphingomicrobium sp. XHP0239]|uniref:DUF2842 domain-containing protein n=1 Tax=Sphingomicrobium maritimum TaxID=3133972 RepID=UPI0031CC4080